MRATVVLVLLAASAPFASAGAGEVRLDGADAASATGDVLVTARGGSAHLVAEDHAAASEVTLRRGEIVLWSRQAVSFGEGAREVRDWTGEPRIERVEVENATVQVRTRGERFDVIAVSAEDGDLVVRGVTEGRGAPVFLSLPVARHVVGADADDLDWTWDEGWAWVGDGDPMWPATSFPDVDAAVLGAEGEVQLRFFGGNATFAGRSVRLGRWSVDEAAPGAGPRVVEYSRLFVTGEVDAVSVPLSSGWGLAAPDLAWRVTGALAWDGADGTARGDAGSASFADARVEGRGEATVRPFRAGTRAGYDAEGEWSRLAVDGRVLVAPPAAGPTARTAGAVAALAAALVAWRAALALYTRIAPEDVLDHPTRRRLLDAARGEPGLHVRDLHRRLGGSWTAFRFHLRFLVGAGYLRTERQGRYKLVYPTAVRDAGDVRVPHPVARAVLDAVPVDGRPVALSAVRTEVGISRQLAAYHAKRLAAEGLLRLGRGPDGRPAVSRVRY